MGGSTSSVSPATEAVIKQEIDTSIINNMLYESVTNNEEVNESTMENVQNMELNVKRNIGCSIETDQTINPGFMASTDQIVDSFANVADGITENLRDQATTAIQKQADLGNISDADLSDINQKVNTKIENEVRNQFKNGLSLVKDLSEAELNSRRTLLLRSVLKYRRDFLKLSLARLSGKTMKALGIEFDIMKKSIE